MIAPLLLSTLVFCGEISLPASGWQKIARALETFGKLPSRANCDAVSKLLPTTMPLMLDGSAEAHEAFQQLEQALPALEALVLSGNRKGVGLAFRLLVTMADGAVAQDLSIMLGKLIGLKPVLFLEELQRVKPPYPSGQFGGLVADLGDEYDYEQTPDAPCRELQLRVRAIESVKQPALSSLRRDCARALREQLTVRSCGAA